MSPDLVEFTLRNADRSSEALRLSYPVGIALRAENKYYVCNYQKLFLVNLAKNHAREIVPPKELASNWFPTGLAFDTATQKLYVANYVGGDVIVLDCPRCTTVRLAGIISRPEMKAPTRVALSDDGQYLAVADYDADRVFVYDLCGELLWQQHVASCHGVSFVRSANGSLYLVAASLREPALWEFDLRGELQKKVEKRSWIDGDGYLYPVALATGSDGRMAVADALRGQVRVLDEKLSLVGGVGGNGPGPRFFNNPYACCWDATGKLLLVADTFKDRLVVVNHATNHIDEIVHLAADDAAPPSPATTRTGPIAGVSRWVRTETARFTGGVLALPPRFDRVSELPYLPQLPLKQPDLPFVRAFGMSYVGEDDPSTTVILPLPRFTAAVAAQGGSEWHPRVSGFCSAAHPAFTASSVGLSGLFTEYPYRFIFGHNYHYRGEHYLLLNSPQCKDVLVCGRGVTVPLPIHKDLWLTGDVLVGPDFVTPARRVVQIGAERIEAYLRTLEEHPPLRAIRLSLFPRMSQAEFELAFKTAMITPAGKAFARACIWARTAEEQCAAAEQYLAYCKTQENNFLSEVMMAEMILCAKNKVPPSLSE
jgi:hypothetical protein